MYLERPEPSAQKQREVHPEPQHRSLPCVVFFLPTVNDNQKAAPTATGGHDRDGHLRKARLQVFEVLVAQVVHVGEYQSARIANKKGSAGALEVKILREEPHEGRRGLGGSYRHADSFLCTGGNHNSFVNCVCIKHTLANGSTSLRAMESPSDENGRVKHQ